MKSKTTPKGWLKLRAGSVIKQGDKCWFDGSWHKTRTAGMQVEHALYIRKLRKARKK